MFLYTLEEIDGKELFLKKKKKIKIEKQFNFLPMAKETIKWLFLMIHAR